MFSFFLRILLLYVLEEKPKDFIPGKLEFVYHIITSHILIEALFKRKEYWGASLVAQWLRIHLPMQGTWVRSLAREDPTCRGATKPRAL